MHLEGNDSTITLDDLSKLQHMLAANHKKAGYRNYYYASRSDLKSMERLKSAGLVHGGPTVFKATLLGCKACALNESSIRRALE